MGSRTDLTYRIDPDSPIRVRSDRHGMLEDLYRDFPMVGVGARYYPGVSEVHKFGRNTDVGTVLETVWNEGGLVPYLTSASVMQISSTDVDDTSAGAGAQIVQIEGLDENWHLVREDVLMNGTTQVATVTTFLRVFRMRVRTVGASFFNEGIIYAGTGAPTAGKPAVVHCLVEQFMGQSLVAFYTIPAGHVGYVVLTNYSSSVTKAVFIGLFHRQVGCAFQIKEPHILRDGEGTILHQATEEIEEMTDLEMRAQVDVAGGIVAAQFELILVKNSP